MSLFLILLAAGDSKRLKSNMHKPFHVVNNKTLLEHSIDIFDNFKQIKKIIVVYNKKNKNRINKLNLKNIIKITGGKTRKESTFKALKKVKAMNCKKVIIHDVARPFTPKNIVINLIDKLKKNDAVIPVMKKIDLIKIILRSIKLHEISEPEISFKISNIKNYYLINGDEEQLNRVFINLIKNSIESIYEKRSKNDDFKGKIIIDIKEDSDYIYVVIMDNGVGFDHVDKSKMVTPYFTTKKNGTGLGLAVVTKIISDHNSAILFKSLKKGAEVELTIPKN